MLVCFCMIVIPFSAAPMRFLAVVSVIKLRLVMVLSEKENYLARDE